MSNNQDEMYKKTFDTVAKNYDNSAMKFFISTAEYFTNAVVIKKDDKVLDLATGTGNVSIRLANKFKNANIYGIDFSSKMLKIAKQKKEELKLTNINLYEMDMQNLDFHDNYFDLITCSFGLFFLEDMKKQLIYLKTKLKENGKIIITTFQDDSFMPIVEILIKKLKEENIEIANEDEEKKVDTITRCKKLFEDSSYRNISCEVKDFGYFMNDFKQLWYVIYNTGFRGLIDQIEENKLELFKEEFHNEILSISKNDKIYLNVNVIFTSATT